MRSIRSRLALRYAASRTRTLGKTINFNEAIKKSETALFLMPRMSMEFYLARSVIQPLARYFRRVVLVVADNLRELAANQSEVVTVSQADENWLKLPGHQIIHRLRHEKFDIAVDLSFSEDVFMSYLCRKSEAKVSAGFSKPDCDRFYDLQVRLPESGDMKKAYEIMTNTIKMFKEK
ncbi:MAG: hypothetical protein M1469_05670 [Bacteroidetes bacterium]|nr:hypothetical protein [Bacteroidota bacterium]